MTQENYHYIVELEDGTTKSIVTDEKYMSDLGLSQLAGGNKVVSYKNMGVATRMNKIDFELQKSDRWGCMEQPTLEEMHEACFVLPLKSVRMISKANYEFEFSRELKPVEAFVLAKIDETDWVAPEVVSKITNGSKIEVFWD